MCESHEKGCVKAVIETDAKEDIRVELFYALANEKLPILSMNRLEKTLEDIFLELIEEDERHENNIEKEQSEVNAEGEDDHESNL